MKKIAIVIGTRPEAIKLIPLILEIKKKSNLTVEVCSTGQHKEMLDQVFNLFQITPDVELKIMTQNQTLADLTSELTKRLNNYLIDSKPDFLICQGDTTTAFVSALVSFYNKIPIGHVEAGLRTNNKFSPFPEEINRQLISKLADFHFAPTVDSKESLILENISPEKVTVTGNTVIDSLFIVKNKIENNELEINSELVKLCEQKQFILVTGHRRENFGEGFENICKSIKILAERFKNINFIYPVHLNPNVKDIVEAKLGGIENVFLIPPLDYINFIFALSKCYLVLTDSGGVQEEAPSFNKPVLVMRENSERMEGVNCGVVKLVGTNFELIVQNVSLLLNDKEAYESMTNSVNPYGDGFASQRIVEIISNYFVKE